MVDEDSWIPAARFTSHTLRSAFAQFPSGIAVLAAIQDDRPFGVVASSFTSVSLQPPLVSVCMAHTSTTWPALRARPHIGVSVLAEEHEAVAGTLGAARGDRFAGVSYEATRNGAVLVDGCTLWLECTLHSEVVAGDHVIALLEIHQLLAQPNVAPLVFHGSRLRRLQLTDDE